MCSHDRSRARRPKAAKVATHAALRAIVEAKLELRWSPQQIAGWLGRTYPDCAAMRISHETIYLSLYVQTRGALRRELTAHLLQRAHDASPVRPRAAVWPRADHGQADDQRASRRG